MKAELAECLCRESPVEVDVCGLVSQIRLRILANDQLEWVLAILVYRIQSGHRSLVVRSDVQARQPIGSHNASRGIRIELPLGDTGQVGKVHGIRLQQMGDD